jgi:WD40 repeat protein
MVVSGGDDGTVRLWHPQGRGAQEAPMQGKVTVCAFLGSGAEQTVVAATDRGVVRRWSASTGQVDPEFSIPRHDGAIHALAAVEAAGRPPILATAGAERVVRMWCLDRSRPVSDPHAWHQGTIGTLTAFVNVAGQPRVASGAADGAVRLWDPFTGRSIGDPLTGFRGSVRRLSATVDSAGVPVLVAQGDANTVRLWREVAADRYRFTDVVVASRVRATAVTAGAVLIGRDNGDVQFHDPETRARLEVVRVANESLLSLAVLRTRGQDLLAAGMAESRVRLWTMVGFALRRTILLPLGQHPLSLAWHAHRLIVRTGHGVLAVALDPRIEGSSAVSAPA